MTKKMKPEVKQLWIDALRSGEYEQTTGTLTAPVGSGFAHCCLGVLCEVAIANGVTVEKKYDDEYGWWCYDGQSAAPPHAVREWAGLKEGNPDVLASNSYFTTSLAALNDKGESFEFIADVIEDQL